MEASSQVQLFLIIVLAGTFLGVFFDGYRVLRGVFRPRIFLTHLLDLLYWLLATLFVFGLLLLINWGEVRFYVFIALAAGAVLYYRFFSRLVMHLFIHTIRGIGKFLYYLRIVVKGVLVPFRYLAFLLLRPFLFGGRKAREFYRVHRLKR